MIQFYLSQSRKRTFSEILLILLWVKIHWKWDKPLKLFEWNLFDWNCVWYKQNLYETDWVNGKLLSDYLEWSGNFKFNFNSIILAMDTWGALTSNVMSRDDLSIRRKNQIVSGTFWNFWKHDGNTIEINLKKKQNYWIDFRHMIGKFLFEFRSSIDELKSNNM